MEQITIKAADCLSMNLKKLRELNDLSLVDLGKITGLSKQSIWNFENGERFPSSDALALLAKAFKIEETDFFNPNLFNKNKLK
ncbi:MAG: helix-turn-helix transcriptional regulator [Alphaproteobacteria bacterium]|nr:helix-turn-helix transcriptional regulator [Alphaproteobacteria bacterium]